MAQQPQQPTPQQQQPQQQVPTFIWSPQPQTTTAPPQQQQQPTATGAMQYPSLRDFFPPPPLTQQQQPPNKQQRMIPVESATTTTTPATTTTAANPLGMFFLPESQVGSVLKHSISALQQQQPQQPGTTLTFGTTPSAAGNDAHTQQQSAAAATALSSMMMMTTTTTTPQQSQQQSGGAFMSVPVSAGGGGDDDESSGDDKQPKQQQQPPMYMTPQQQQQGMGAGGIQNLPVAQISLSTYKIFKFRTFSLFLELNSAYVKKAKLTEDDIHKAGLNAKCFKDSASDQELFSCPICSAKKKIIEVDISSKQVFGPKHTPYGTEIYTFDMCKSNCSSSRDHHKSHLLIGIDSLPGCGMISSMPFMVQAREKQQSLRKSLSNKAAALAAAAVTGGSLSPPPQQADDGTGTGASSSQVSSLLSQQAMDQQAPLDRKINPSPAAPLITSHGVSAPPLGGNGPMMMMMPGNAGPISMAALASLANMAPDRQSQTELKVKVALASVSIPTADVDRLVQHFKGYLQAMPGFIQFKYSILPGMVVGFSFFDTEEHHAATSGLIRNYMQNTGGVTNLYNCNLVENGIAVLLAVCNSW